MGQKENWSSDECLQDRVFIIKKLEGRVYPDQLHATDVHQSPNFHSLSELQNCPLRAEVSKKESGPDRRKVWLTLWTLTIMASPQCSLGCSYLNSRKSNSRHHFIAHRRDVWTWTASCYMFLPKAKFFYLIPPCTQICSLIHPRTRNLSSDWIFVVATCSISPKSLIPQLILDPTSDSAFPKHVYLHKAQVGSRKTQKPHFHFST